MNKENSCNRNVEGDAVICLVDCVSREEVVQTLGEVKTENVSGLIYVPLDLITASGGVKILVMAEICQSPRWI